MRKLVDFSSILQSKCYSVPVLLEKGIVGSKNRFDIANLFCQWFVYGSKIHNVWKEEDYGNQSDDFFFVDGMLMWRKRWKRETISVSISETFIQRPVDRIKIRLNSLCSLYHCMLFHFAYATWGLIMTFIFVFHNNPFPHWLWFFFIRRLEQSILIIRRQWL